MAGSPVAALLALSLLLAATGCRDEVQEPELPAVDPPAKNVVLITLDALRQDHLSLAGYPRSTSPHIDRLAARGAVLRDVIPPSCSTKGSLTSLLIGRDLSEHGVVDHRARLDPRHPTLSEAFRDHGYATAGFVATPHLAAELGYDRGFDHYRDFAPPAGDGGAAASPTATPAAEQVGAAVRAHLDRIGRRPFFLYVHFEEPHPPWRHPPPWPAAAAPEQLWSCSRVPTARELAAVDEPLRAGLTARYDAAIAAADHQIGLLVEELARRGELERTAIAVTTDHGFDLLDRYSLGHGHNPYDEVVRGFAVLFDGGRPILRPSRAVQGRLFDLGPTLLGMAGVEAPAAVTGVDLLRHPERVPELAFTACYNGVSVRSLDHKLVSIRFRRYPDRSPAAREGVFLYDLRADPGETLDVSESEPERRRTLERALVAYRRESRTARAGAPRGEPGASTRRRLRALGYL